MNDLSKFAARISLMGQEHQLWFDATCNKYKLRDPSTGTSYTLYTEDEIERELDARMKNIINTTANITHRDSELKTKVFKQKLFQLLEEL